MRARVAALLLAALPVPVPVSGAATSRAGTDPLAGRTEGPAVRCLNDTVVGAGPIVVDRHTVVYGTTNRRIWAVHPEGSCPSLRPLTTLVVEKWGSQTCAGDRFRVLVPGTTIPSASCRFGMFVPYDRPGR